ncbi:inosine monophosphate dehydrogenase [Paramyrothecium foliicola]|nr:inosine monophosphate dehydrogenase [Paramyrothecium foliicola]
MASIFDYLPWVTKPLVINAPMAGFAGGRLASAVTLAGGLGMIGSVNNMNELRENLRVAADACRTLPAVEENASSTLPVGVGLLPFACKLEDVLSVLSDYKPTVVWLFAAKELDDYSIWASRIRAVSSQSKIWIQVGNVSAAIQIAKTARPDAICLQGSDAGGHGFEKGSGIISLLPEATDTFTKEGISIPFVASGGIVDGRGAAAALVLGARGVVMGTRFLASEEVKIHAKYQAAILEARDGGQVTTRSKVFDELKGPNVWPEPYDGRSLVVQSYADHNNGVPIEEIRQKHTEAVAEEDRGYDTGLRGRAAIWAGTGVGLVNDVRSAKQIVEDVRREAKVILNKTLEQTL